MSMDVKREVERKEVLFDRFTEFIRKNDGDYYTKERVIEALKSPWEVLDDFDGVTWFYRTLSDFIVNEVSARTGKNIFSADINVYDEALSVTELVVTARFRFGGKVREVVLMRDNLGDYGRIAGDEREFNEKMERVINTIVDNYNDIKKYFGKMRETSNKTLVRIHFYDNERLVDDTLYALVPKGMTEEKLQKIVDKLKEEMVDEEGDPYWSNEDIYEELEKRFGVKFLEVKKDFDILL